MTESIPLLERVRRARLFSVLGVYGASSFAVIQAVDILSNQLGLPDWVFVTTLVLIIVGIPIVVATAWLQARHARATEPKPVAPKKRHWLTWRRVLTGGAFAFTGLGAVTGLWMLSRAIGIGPGASLVSAGVLDAADEILVADFHSTTGDSVLADVVTEAFRVDLSQSTLLAVVDPLTLREALTRMQRPAGAALDLELARELAQREGIGAVVAGEIGTAGPAHQISVRLIAAADGRSLISLRETARDSTGVIDAVDRLSRKLRERIGESLRTIRGNEPLERVTTASLPALRLYTQAVQAIEVDGNHERGVGLLEQALSADTAFAMAWRKLAVVLINRREERTRANEALERAFAHRDRLTARERWMTEASYYRALGDASAERAALEALLSEYPDDAPALNNLALTHIREGDWLRAGELLRRSVELRPSPITYHNLADVQTRQGEYDAAEAVLAEALARFPDNSQMLNRVANLAYDRFDHARADSVFRALHDASNDAGERGVLAWRLAAVAATRGRLREAEGFWQEAGDLNREIGYFASPITVVFNAILADVRVRFDTAAAIRRLERALAERPLEAMPPLDRPYLDVAFLSAAVGRAEDARRFMAAYTEVLAESQYDHAYMAEIRSVVALAEGRPEEAAGVRRPLNTLCTLCTLAEAARAWDAAGNADSALAQWSRYVDTPAADRIDFDVIELPVALERLADLYDQRGDTSRAIRYYGRFIELWHDADPELQPRVEAARRRLAELTREG